MKKALILSFKQYAGPAYVAQVLLIAQQSQNIWKVVLG